MHPENLIKIMTDTAPSVAVVLVVSVIVLVIMALVSVLVVKKKSAPSRG